MVLCLFVPFLAKKSFGFNCLQSEVEQRMSFLEVPGSLCSYIPSLIYLNDFLASIL